MLPKSSFLADGYQRAYDAAYRIASEQVWAEYQTRWQEASLLAKIQLRAEIEHQITKRVRQVAPPDALY
jgi:hypothetical protein